MTRRPCTFKQQDITRAVRAVVAAGQQVKRVEIDRDGRIVISTDDAAKEQDRNYKETATTMNGIA